MPIPFPPDGPQVQAALQKVPTPQLQNYAAGRPPQPTGQVTPGPMGAAAEALNARGAMGAANQRQQAMQNNPANSPTIFQQKDMELQQKAQQLAAMGQQIQQKEQQLGVLGALMAKKAQDMQARESMGVANLPIRPDMFTAMDGGIVFSGGGGVEGYARRGLVQDLGMLEDRMAEGFTERGIDRMIDEEEEDPLQRRIRNIEKAAERRRLSAESALYTPEQKEALESKERERLGEQYSRYKQGIAGLDEEAAAAIRGKPANTMQGIAAGLAALPADLRNVRLAGLMAKLSGGVAGERARAEDREREANKYLIDARRKAAAADLAEERNQDTLARALRKSEQDDRLKADALLGSAATTEIESQRGIGALEETRRERDQRAKEAAARQAFDEKKFASEEAYRAGERAFKEKMVRLEASLRPKEFYNQLLGMATNPKDPNYEFAKNLLEARGGRSGAGADGRPSFADYQKMVQDRLDRVTDRDRKEIGAALGRKPTEKDIRDAITTEVRTELENEFGAGLFKGQGGRGSTPSTKTPPAVGTVMEGYKFKGGDPSKQENWEKI
jgi:hypothetical protein